VGKKTIASCDSNILLPDSIITKIQEEGRCTLNHINNLRLTIVWNQSWLSVDDLGLQVEEQRVWINFVHEIHKAYI